MLSRTFARCRFSTDITIKVTGDTSVTNFSIAVERNYTFKGEEKPRTDFWDCRCWGKKGETIARLFKKGDNVILEGHYENDNYEKDGSIVYHTIFIVENFDFAGSRSSAATADS